MGRRPNLSEYRRKRDFRATPEPAPSKAAAAGPRATFMVHKHDATRLHYDLRLEMDGALASWAIPKGPSYDPQVKRLAVQTEDHPLEYGSFEGRIPEGEYGAGDSIVWDRGTYDTSPPGQASAMRKKGHLALDLDGQKLKGRWHLVRTRGGPGGKEQWLCFKAKDGLEDPAYDVIAERPESVVSGRRLTRGPERARVLRGIHPPPDKLLDRVWPPMAATLSRPGRAPPAQFVYEVKYDGYRGLAAVCSGRVAFWTRNRQELSPRFPELSRALARLTVGEAVLDGEVIALDARGVSRFQLLESPRADHRYAAFDLLWLDGEDLRGRPLEDRRELLQSVLANVPPPIEVAERVPVEDVEAAVEEARRRGLEGLLAKRRGSAYAGGRSADWLKLKVGAGQELAIVGFTPIKTGAPQIGALLVAAFDGKRFQYAGKVGTGFTARSRGELYRMLEGDRVESPPVAGAPRVRGATWVRPRKVAEIAFTEWTADGKLRHPSFQGLRPDKRPEDCIRERPQPRGSRARPQAKAARTARLPPREEPVAAAAEVTLTSGDRVVFPRDGFTKREVFEYYRAVAGAMVPALDGRPLAFQQWPQGIGHPGHFRQQVRSAPPWATVVKVPSEGGRQLEKLIVDREETLLWLANQNAYTLHMGSSRVPHLGEPDWVIFDLDPGDGDWGELIQVATALKRLLDQLGIQSVPKTSGQRGLHVLVPIARGHTHEDALEFAIAVTRTLERGLPRIATTERARPARRGRLYLDAFQNGRGKTLVAPYSLRPLDGAPASAPLRWSEVAEGLDPLAFNLRTLPRRLLELGDLFAPALRGAQRLPRFR